MVKALAEKASRKAGWRKTGSGKSGSSDAGGDADGEPRRRARPLDAARLDELALAYVARFATSAAKLADYLARKLRERGWDQDGDGAAGGAGSAEAEAAIAAIVTRCVAAGYVDDAGFARARAGGLLRRGYGKRRITQAMGEAGIEAEIVATVLPDMAEARAAALLMARRRRFGPFGRDAGSGDGEDADDDADREPEDGDPRAAAQATRAKREREIAAMLRAGHPLDIVRELLDAASAKAATRWAQDAG